MTADETLRSLERALRLGVVRSVDIRKAKDGWPDGWYVVVCHRDTLEEFSATASNLRSALEVVAHRFCPDTREGTQP